MHFDMSLGHRLLGLMDLFQSIDFSFPSIGRKLSKNFYLLSKNVSFFSKLLSFFSLFCYKIPGTKGGKKTSLLGTGGAPHRSTDDL